MGVLVTGMATAVAPMMDVMPGMVVGMVTATSVLKLDPESVAGSSYRGRLGPFRSPLCVES